MPTTAETIREALIAARRDRRLIETASLPVPASLAEGLAIARTVSRGAGLEDLGWKVAIAEDGTPIAPAHERLPVFGLQFHPESVLTEHGHLLLANFLASGAQEDMRESA